MAVFGDRKGGGSLIFATAIKILYIDTILHLAIWSERIFLNHVSMEMC